MPVSQSLILLVCVPNTPTQRLEVEGLLDKIHPVLDSLVHVMYVSEMTHPEVVRSFGVGTSPVFVLVQQGLELWRCTGPVDGFDLLSQVNRQMQRSSPNLE